MELLTRDAILAAPDLRAVDVEVPEWGGMVRVRMLTAAERDRFELSFVGTAADAQVNVRARLVALTLCDQQGVRLFSEADITVLGQKSGAALDRVFEAASRLNAITDRDIDDLGKPCSAVLNGYSPSASPSA